MLYLYGDSFVENERAELLGMHDHERWYQMLSNNMDEDHRNFGKCGEGPQQSLEKFHKHLYNDTFDSDSKFVFVLSSPYRIPWQFLKPQKDNKYINEDKRTREHGLDPSSAYQDWLARSEGNDDLVEYHYLPEELFVITSCYEAMQEELNHQTIKNVSYLRALSLINKWPMVVFRVFSMSPDPFGKRYENEEKIIEDMESLNNDLFKFWGPSLQRQSAKEWHDEIIREAGTLNHFTYRNHIILSNIITNHFKKTDLTEEWHEHFIRDVENREHRHDPNPDKLVDFIYE